MSSIDRQMDQIEERVRSMTVTRVSRKVRSPDGSEAVVSEMKLEELLRRARHLMVIDHRAGSAVADGFPSTTPGNGSPGSGKGGGKMMTIPGDPEHPDDDVVPTSSTEAAALADVAGDPIRRLAVATMARVRNIARELEELDATLGAFDRIRLTSKVPDPPQCYVARELLGLPWDPEWDPFKSTTFPKLDDVRFDEPRRVCKWVYWFVRDNERLPTRDEAIKHLYRTAVDRQAGRAK